MIITKKCPNCNELYFGERWKLKKQKYCSIDCANKSRRGDANPSKRPEVREKIRKSKQKEWADKRSKYHTMVRNWTPESKMKLSLMKTLDKPTKWTFRKYALKHFPNECYLCGDNGRLIVHHKDHNRENNTIENLSILCFSCHNILHKYAVKYPIINKERFSELFSLLITTQEGDHGK